MSDQPLVSSAWHRVAGLRPSLSPDVRVVRQPARDQVWHLLVEPATGRQMRLNPAAWDVVGRLDGRSTVAQLWERVLTLRGEQAPTQDEMLQLVAQLFRGGLVQFDAAPNLASLFARRDEEDTRRRRARLNPFMVRIPLVDPQRWLDRLLPLAGVLFTRAAWRAWCLLVAVAAVVAAMNAPELRAQAGRVLASPGSYLLAWLAYPVVKLLHEAAHGLALRHFGGTVREAGLSLVLLVPAPYVDAQAATAFSSRRQRILVSAAGILVELAVGALALLAWTQLQPGTARDAALAVVLICWVSTLVFNANPLVRLDGYHVLCDALDLPNLSTRSQAWWTRTLAALVQRRGAAPQASLLAGERKWLVAYAPASLAYRLFVWLAFVAWIGVHSWLLGLAALLLALGWAVRMGWRWLGRAAPAAQRWGAGALAAIAAIALLVPLPQTMVAQGVVWPAPAAQLRAVSGGFVHRLLPDGAGVAPGDGVLELVDEELQASAGRLAEEEASLRAQQYRVLLTQPSTYLQLQADVDRVQAEIARAEEQLAGLRLRAGAAGRVAWTRPQDLPGSFAARGTLLGHVVGGDSLQVRVALPEDDFLLLHGRVRAAQVRLAQDPARTWSGELLPQAPGATRELPSPALGQSGGGAIPVEPGKATLARARVFLLDVRVPALRDDIVGGRAWVKFRLDDEPVAARVWRRLQQALLQQLSPTGRL
jgi:putative peptide zinc metalloprotease protein